MGGVLVVPALVMLIGRLGFTPGVAVLVALMILVLTPLVLALLERGPEALGLAPDGENPATRAGAPGAGLGAVPARPFLRTWHFWSVATPFALGITAQISVIIHQVSFLRPVLGADGAAWAVSLTSACAVLGRLVVGSFVDRVSKRGVIAGNFVVQAAGIGVMLADPTPALLFLGCALFGLGVGNTTSLPSVIVQAEFPRAAFGRVVSTIIAINQLTYSVGPGLVGWLRDAFGGYHVAFAVCVALELAAVAILWLGARATPRSQHSTY